jgi:GTPase
VSNIKWEGLKLFKSFLSMLPVVSPENQIKDNDNCMEFDIHETLFIEGKLIVTGIINKGRLVSESKCLLGPYNDGNYKIVEVVNIHCKKIPVKFVNRGQYCSIYIKSENGLTKEDVRKGMVLLDIYSDPIAAKMFEAELWTIDGTKKLIKYKYQPILNIKHIRQGCKVKNMSEMLIDDDEKILTKLFYNKSKNLTLENMNILAENLRMRKLSDPSDKMKPPSNFTEEGFSLCSTLKTKVIFEFMFNPEYITVGSHVIINDQLIKAFGVITKIFK